MVWNDKFTEYLNLFWGVGYFGHAFAVLYSLYTLVGISIPYVVLYTILLMVSIFFNTEIMKKYIDSPRPLNSIPFLASERFTKHINGMPSGHAQQCAFSLTFTYLLSKQYFYESLVLFSLTIYQRYSFKNHTVMQLFMGTVIGFLAAYISVYMIQKHMVPMNIMNKTETETKIDLLV